MNESEIIRRIQFERFFNELDIDSADIIRILVLLMTGAYITFSNASQLN